MIFKNEDQYFIALSLNAIEQEYEIKNLEQVEELPEGVEPIIILPKEKVDFKALVNLLEILRVLEQHLPTIKPEVENYELFLTLLSCIKSFSNAAHRELKPLM